MFQLPKEVKEGLEKYKDSLEENKSGKISPARFKGIRVPWGIYSHRGQKVYMTRIRIPAGTVTASQLDALASASKKYGSGLLHLTTRQDIQIHDVKIEDTIKVMEYLKDYDLSPRGGGGNTVRNVIACPFSGLCEGDVIDTRGYAIALSEYLLRDDLSFNLPRKFKVAFSGCSDDCTGVLLSDVGLFARIKDGNKGFRVFVGGGMGANSRIGKLLIDFLPEEDLGYCVKAVRNVFYKKGDRRNKRHNRLRFLIQDDMGFDKFKESYDEEFNRLKANEHIVLREIKFDQRPGSPEGIPQVEDKEFKEFLKYSARPQKHEGFFIVTLRISRGDLKSEELSSLAGLGRDFKGIQFASTQDQNLALAWVKAGDLHKLFLKLKEIQKDFLYPNTLLDIVACKGAVTCNLGLCNSPALSKELEEAIKKEFLGKAAFEKCAIRINGCPNSCGHHPVGKIALHGLVRRVGNKPVPFYQVLLGGRKAAERTRLAEPVGSVPARNVPKFLKDFLEKLEEDLTEDRDIYKVLEEKGKSYAKNLIKKYSYVPPHSEDRDFYVDWGREEEFSLEGLGPGECGSGILDMIESDLTDAKISLEKAEKENYAAKNIKKALFLSARALLVVKGKEPKTEAEAFSDFKENFIDEGIASGSYSDIKDIFSATREALSPEERKEKYTYAKGFLDEINSLYKVMDSTFNFPKKEAPVKKEETEAKLLDLKGTPCPINYVKAKLFLENLDSGDILEVLLDEGEPMDNVPKSLEGDGHQILKIEKQNGFYSVVVKKK